MIGNKKKRINQPGGNDATRSIDGLVGGEISNRTLDGHDAPGGNRQIADLVEAGGGVDDTAILDEEFHFIFPKKAAAGTRPKPTLPGGRQTRGSGARLPTFSMHPL